MNKQGTQDPSREEAANDNAGEDINDASDDGSVQSVLERNLAAEYLDALQRERATFLNYKRRAEQDRDEAGQRATANLLRKLLPVVDDFDRAMQAIPEAERENSPWVKGVELIARKLHTLLDQEGVEAIEAQGQPFDPNLHEAVAFEEGGGDHQQDLVSEVFAKGYKHRDKVLRPAIVKVTRG
ncbi:MAG: nucleotide exchange factor GrpE [Chloroflexota bacterium]|nr:nucleotide exchange factor GrpE [Chloroflexota bacterium]